MGRILFAVLAFSLLMPASYAMAYLDPGTGNVLINIVIAGIGALLFTIRGAYYSLTNKGKGGRSEIAGGEADIALFSEGKAYWTTFKPLVEELVAKRIRFSYYSLDIEDPGLAIESEYVSSRFLGYGMVSKLNFYRIRAKALLSTTPNIGTPEYPLKRPPSVGKMIHVFHSINDISAYRTGSLDFYDMVFMVGDFQEKSIREIESIRGLPKKELIPLGLPYLDVFIGDKKETKKADSPKTVLIGSSWGDKGCLVSYGSGFIKAIAKEGHDVIIRPHPYSLKVEAPLLDKLRRELKPYGNIAWDTAVSPVESMNKADLLVSDTSSIRFDFAFIYEKPVITLDIKSEEMPGFERDFLKDIWTDGSSRKIGMVIEREEIHAVNESIGKALAEFDSSMIRDFRDATIANFGKAAPAMVERVIELVSSEGAICSKN